MFTATRCIDICFFCFFLVVPNLYTLKKVQWFSKDYTFILADLSKE